LQHEDQGEQPLAARPRRQSAIEADNRRMTQDILVRDMEEQMAYHAEQLDVTAVKELMSLIAETQDNVDEDAVESEEMREPKHWRDAIRVPQWRGSMQSEIDSLVRRGTWELVDRRNANRIMKSVWASNASAMRDIDQVDPGLYINTKPGLPSIVLTYVDDLLMVSLTKGNEELESCM
jgi:hypothetical protein